MNYTISTDYERLWKLITSGKVVFCFAYTCGSEEEEIGTSVSYTPDFLGYPDFSIRGISGGTENTAEELKSVFMRVCEDRKLRFIDPASQQKTQKEEAAARIEELEAALSKIDSVCSPAAICVNCKHCWDSGVIDYCEWRHCGSEDPHRYSCSDFSQKDENNQILEIVRAALETREAGR